MVARGDHSVIESAISVAWQHHEALGGDLLEANLWLDGVIVPRREPWVPGARRVVGKTTLCVAFSTSLGRTERASPPSRLDAGIRTAPPGVHAARCVPASRW